jgi:hypothetical protein
MKPHRIVPLTVTLLVTSVLFSACGKDCREMMRGAEFEFQQRNFARAEKLFDDAYKADPAQCPDAKDRRAEALRFLGR